MQIWFVDAFAERVFTGNTAAVAPLPHFPSDAVLQAIAAENNCSETAFFTPTGLKGNYALRWFTPETEVPICGHATLAAGAVLLRDIDPGLEVVVFDTAAGPLVVRKGPGEAFTMDLPRRPRTPWEPPAELAAALGRGVEIEDAFVGEYANLVLASEEEVRRLAPDVAAIERLVRGPRAGCLAVTARAEPGSEAHFVSRFFAPGVGLPEDSVTGSSFADLTPYWCDRLNLEEVVGRQASARGGLVRGAPTLLSARLTGRVALYMKGELSPEVSALVMGAADAPAASPAAAIAAVRDDLVVRVMEDEDDIIEVSELSDETSVRRAAE